MYRKRLMRGIDKYLFPSFEYSTWSNRWLYVLLIQQINDKIDDQELAVMFKQLSFPSELTSSPSWLTLGLVGTILVFGTYIYTSLRWFLQSMLQPDTQKRPLTLPYWIPFVGHTIWVVRDAHGLYEAAA